MSLCRRLVSRHAVHGVRLALLSVVSAAVALCGFGCSTGKVAGGNGSETTNGFAGVAVLADGSPAVSVPVRVVAADDWYTRVADGAPLLDSTTTDSLGRFVIDGLSRGTYRLIAGSSIDGAMVDHVFYGYDSISNIGIVPLVKTTRLSGSLLGAPIGTKVALAGTPYVSYVDAAGGWLFPSVPRGTHTLVAVTATDVVPVRSFMVDSFASVNIGFDTLADGFLLDDFDDGNAFSLWAGAVGNSHWYAYNDADRGGASEVLPIGMRDDFALGITTEGAWRGRSVHAKFCLALPLENPSGAVACRLDRDAEHLLDATNLTGISFMAKGKGQFRVTVITKRVLDSYTPENQWGHFGCLFVADSVWTPVTIAANLLTPMANSPQANDGLTWAQCRDSVTSIVIGSWQSTPGDTVDIMLDDIRLHGVRADNVR